jgi:hypothetical protein
VNIDVGGTSLASDTAGAAAVAGVTNGLTDVRVRRKRGGCKMSITGHAVAEAHVDGEVQPHELVDAAGA